MAVIGTQTHVGAEINWPLVAGLGVTAAVLFYALYIVNGQLQQVDNAVTGIASPFAAISSAISNFFNGGGSDQ